MATPQENCVCWFVLQNRIRCSMQQNFCTYFRKISPSNNRARQKKFLATRNVLDWKRSGQSKTGEENFEYIREIFQCSLAESTNAAAKNCN